MEVIKENVVICYKFASIEINQVQKYLDKFIFLGEVEVIYFQFFFSS